MHAGILSCSFIVFVVWHRNPTCSGLHIDAYTCRVQPALHCAAMHQHTACLHWCIMLQVTELEHQLASQREEAGKQLQAAENCAAEHAKVNCGRCVLCWCAQASLLHKDAT